MHFIVDQCMPTRASRFCLFSVMASKKYLNHLHASAVPHQRSSAPFSLLLTVKSHQEAWNDYQRWTFDSQTLCVGEALCHFPTCVYQLYHFKPVFNLQNHRPLPGEAGPIFNKFDLCQFPWIAGDSLGELINKSLLVDRDLCLLWLVPGCLLNTRHLQFVRFYVCGL